MNKQFQNNIKNIEDLFPSTLDSKTKYLRIIELGKNLPTMPLNYKIEENKVPGCKSILYFYTYEENAKTFFYADSDALISKGLAALLILAYQKTPIDTILKEPPTFLKDLDIQSSLSFNRSNGLSHIHLKMKKQALGLFQEKIIASR